MKKRVLVCVLTMALIISSISAVNASALPKSGENYSAAESAVLNAWNNLEDSVNIYEYGINSDEINKLYDYIKNRNLEYFYVDLDSYSIYGQSIYGLNFKYIFDKDEIPEMINIFNQKSEEILSKIPVGVSDEEKLLILHDYLAGTTAYESKVYSQPEYDDGYIRTSYGCIVRRRAVCEGISKAFSYFCKKLGINCYLVTSDAMCHQWNMVELNGKYYHIDVTQDAPMYYLNDGSYYQPCGDVTHTFFLKSDAQMSDNSLGSAKHYEWDISYRADDGNTFKNAFWTEANGMVNYKNGKYYYIKGADFVEYDYSSLALKKLYTIENSTWKGSSGHNFVYKGEYSKAVVDSNKNYCYFTLANKVCAYNLDNGRIFDIYTLQGNGFIYSLLYENGNIKISVRDSKKDSSNNIIPLYSELSFAVSLSDETIKKGDVDGNGNIEIKDVLLLYKYLLKTESAINFNNADINNDSKVDMKDVLFLRKNLVG